MSQSPPTRFGLPALSARGDVRAARRTRPRRGLLPPLNLLPLPPLALLLGAAIKVAVLFPRVEGPVVIGLRERRDDIHEACQRPGSIAVHAGEQKQARRAGPAVTPNQPARRPPADCPGRSADPSLASPVPSAEFRGGLHALLDVGDRFRGPVQDPPGSSLAITALEIQVGTGEECLRRAGTDILPCVVPTVLSWPRSIS